MKTLHFDHISEDFELGTFESGEFCCVKDFL